MTPDAEPKKKKHRISGNVEKKTHRDAFELYYAYGDKRSAERVATAMGLNPKTVKEWRTVFNWVERVKERDQLLSDALSAEAIMAMKQAKSQIITLVRKAIEEMMVLYKDGVTVKGSKIKAFDVSDLEKLIKTYQLVTGEATERFGAEKGGVLRVPVQTTCDEWEKTKK